MKTAPHVLLLLLLLVMVAGEPSRAASQSLEEAITSSDWSWVIFFHGRDTHQELRFFKGGFLQTQWRANGQWQIKDPHTVVLSKKGESTSLTFNDAFTRYDGLDFDGKTKVWGIPKNSVDPDRKPPANSAERISNPSPEAPPDAAPTAPSPAAGKLIQSHSASLVVVKGSEGAGSGFVCKDANSTALYTNIHVIADLLKPTFTRMDGAVLSTGAANLAAGRDIARIEIKEAPDNPLEVITNFEQNVLVGDEIVVLGNSGGGGVVTSIKGIIVGIGPDRIEVSAKFIPGNSGSPIIHVKTGQVVGIATYLTMRREDPTKAFNVAVRHFGYRIDNVAKWEGVDWNLFRQDANSMRQVSALTDDVLHFLRSLETKQPPQFATDTLRHAAAQWMDERSGSPSGADRHAANAGFLRALRMLVMNDVTAIEPRIRYTYFREEMQRQRETREELYKAFDRQLHEH